MSDFKPLYPPVDSLNESRSFRAKIVNADPAIDPGNARFASLPAAPAHAHDTSAGPKVTSPKVTFRRDGDRITHIQVECGCGQIIDLECGY